MSDTYKDHGHPPGWENELDPRCQACAQSELASSAGSAASAADALGVRKEYDAFMAAVAAAREGLDDACPRCGSSAQVWPNQLTGKLTCHRAGCHVELPPNDQALPARGNNHD